jgi:hypothetical protein
MRTTTLAAPLLALLLVGCQDTKDTQAAVAAGTPEPAIAPEADCAPLGPPTVVRYHSRLASSTQHSVHLLNSGAEASALPSRTSGCDPKLPLASTVILSYRIAGG